MARSDSERWQATSHQMPLLTAVETIGTIVLGGFQMVAERQRFEQDLKRLQHKDMTAQQNLLMLIQLADQANLTDEARNHLVTAICELALK